MRNGTVPTVEEFERLLPIAAIVDEYLSKDRRKIETWVGSRYHDPSEPDTREPGPFHMSGGVCLRDEVLKRENARGIPVRPTSQRIWAIGNMIEQIVLDALRWKNVIEFEQIMVWADWAFRPGRGDVLLPPRRPGSPGYRDLSGCLVVGTLDVIARWSVEWAGIVGPIPNEVIRATGERVNRYLTDVKSCNEKKFDLYLDKPDEAYHKQVAGYADLFIRMPQYGQWAGKINGLRLAYVEKNNMRIKQIDVPMGEWIPKARERMRLQRLASGILPDELPADHWKCKPEYCGFAVARGPDGMFLCPTVGKKFADLVQKRVESKRPIGDLEYAALALKQGESLYGDVEPEPETQEVH